MTRARGTGNPSGPTAPPVPEPGQLERRGTPDPTRPNAVEPRIQRVPQACGWRPASVRRRPAGVRRACRRRPAGGWRAWVLALDVRDRGAAGLLRDRDRGDGTALLPVAVTTACGKHRGTPGTALWPAS